MTITKGWNHPLAECKGMDPNIFHPERGGHVDPRAVIACARCPVRNECLTWAVEHKEDGYWGGTTVRQRRELRSKEWHAAADEHATRLILDHLHRHAGDELTIAQIADAIGRSHSTTRQACLALRRQGLVRSRTHLGHRPMTWYVHADVEVGVG